MSSPSDPLSEAILQSLAAEIAVLDRDGTIVRVNAAWNTFARENGAPDLAGSSEGRNYLAVCDQAIKEEAEQALEARAGLEAILAGTLPLFILEYPCHSPQEERWFLLYATPLQGEEGKAVVAHLNITQRKHLERLAAANQEMSDFLNLVSHEVRTPLTSISGNAQIAQRHLHHLLSTVASTGPPGASLEHPAARLHADLDQILVHTQRLNRLITDLAEVAQMQSRKLTLQLERVDLSRIVWETVQEQQQARPNRTLQVALPGQAVRVQADVNRIRQVLTNYLMNAFTYAPADRPIVVSLHVGATQVCVAVRDQGPGLSAEEQERIWERWYRVPGAQVQEGPGLSMGMGLFIVRRIITLHGGETGVVSAPGAGATFWFTLPRSAV